MCLILCRLFFQTWKRKVQVSMFSPEMMRFLLTRDNEEYVTENKKEYELGQNRIFRHAAFATIPIEVKD